MSVFAALSVAPALLLLLLAGRALAAWLLPDLLDDDDAPAFSFLLGATAVAFLGLAGAACGATTSVWAVGLGVLAAAFFAKRLARPFALEMRRAAPRLLVFLVVAALAVAAAHGRQISLADGGLAWRGTLGRETLNNMSVAHASLRSYPPRVLGSDGLYEFGYHTPTLVFWGWLAAFSAASLLEVFARIGPVLCLAALFESHFVLLRSRWPRSRALVVAAAAPLFAMDLGPWLRLVGVAESESFENRTGTTLLLSPTFVMGQMAACLALACAARALARPGTLRSSSRAALGIGVVAGCVIGWKLPSAALLAVGLCAMAPRAARQEGGRALARAALATTAVAAATYVVCFHPTLLVGRGALPGLLASMTPLPGFDAATGGAAATCGLALWYVVQATGPRLLRLRALVARARADPLVLAALAMCAAGLALPLLVGSAAGAQEKYLRRCGGYVLFLLTAALVAKEIEDRGPRLRTILETACFGVFAAGTAAFFVRGGPFVAELTKGEVAALRSLAERPRHVLLSPAARERYEYVFTGISGVPVWHESLLFQGGPECDLDDAGFEELSREERPTALRTRSEELAARRPFDTFVFLPRDARRWPHLDGLATLHRGPHLVIAERR